MRVTIDESKCQGHARCNLLAPEVFDLDEQGHATIRDNGEIDYGSLDKVKMAVMNCPEGAIEVDI